jgi:trans-L-3-hydroxyproline dehydratase
MAILAARGQMGPDDRLVTHSIIGSSFEGRILEQTRLGPHMAILPEISGRAWITGIHQHMLDPGDPWPGGYRLSDTWPGA